MADNNDDDKKKKDYKVGYGKPPKSGQFKPGQSGNPNGRPKGHKNFKTDLEEELAVTVTVTENGKKIKIPKQKAVIKSMLAKSILGNEKSQSLTISSIAKFLGTEGEDPFDQISQSDLEILQQFLEKVQADKDYVAENEGETDDE